MKNEKIAAIFLIIIVLVASFAYIGTIEDLFGNLFEPEPEATLTIELGDCVDLYYIGKLTNGTIFSSSYNDTINKTGGLPLNLFVSTNTSEDSPIGFEGYTNLVNNYYIKGLIEGLVGLKEGDLKTIGLISPADAYGRYPKVGDNFTIPDPSSRKEINIQFVDIITNSTMPKEYIDYYGNVNTTLFILRFDYYSVGEKTTVYPAWKNATIVTKINETKLWMYTTPPEHRITNFTWTSIINDGYTGIIYPDNTSSVTGINDTMVIVTHNPQKGAIITQVDYLYGYTYHYTVLNLTNEKINVNYVDESTGNTSYYEFNRTETIHRNESQTITYKYPLEELEQLLNVLKMYYNPDLSISVNEFADEYLIFEVKILKIYKTS